jgi:hypothetical protein
VQVPAGDIRNPKMTLFGPRPGLEAPGGSARFGVIPMRDIHDCSSGKRIRIEECIYSMILRMEDCATLVEAIEEKRLDNEHRTKGWNKAGKPDLDAEELFDQFVASGNKLGAALKRLQSAAAFEEGLLYPFQDCLMKRLMQSSKGRGSPNLREGTRGAPRATRQNDGSPMVISS